VPIAPAPTSRPANVSASKRLNFYDGQPHIVDLWIFPLSSPLGFEASEVEVLLGGEAPEGALGEPRRQVILPGAKRELELPVPAGARYLGVIADYYRASGRGAGARKATLEVACGEGAPALALAADRIEDRER
jgi:hypothetical protein